MPTTCGCTGRWGLAGRQAALPLTAGGTLGAGLQCQCATHECCQSRIPKPLNSGPRVLSCPCCTAVQPHVYRFEPDLQHSGFERFTVKFAHGEPACPACLPAYQLPACLPCCLPTAANCLPSAWLPAGRPACLPASNCLPTAWLPACLPADIYPEHHTAFGYNAFGIQESGNCWIRDVKIINSDNSISVQRSDFVTVTGVTVSVEKPRWTALTEPTNGHHALWAVGAVNSLFTE